LQIVGFYETDVNFLPLTVRHLQAWTPARIWKRNMLFKTTMAL